MTSDTNQKIRGLLLAALMVTSVFAGTIAFAGTAAAANVQDGDADVRYTNQNAFYEGQEVIFGGYDNNEEVDVFALDSDDERTVLVTQVTADTDGDVVVDTGDLGTGDFEIEGTTGSNGATDTQFSIVKQQFSVDFDDSTVTNGETADSKTALDVTSPNRAGNFSVNVSADGLNSDELETIFGNYYITNVDSSDDIVTVTLNKGETKMVNFTDIDQGDYEINFSVTDTTAEASDTISVDKVGDKSSSFEDSSIAVEKGDTGEITVNLQNTDSAYVQIGVAEDDGYQVVAEVVDGDDDGMVNVSVDTFDAEATDNVSLADASSDDDVIVDKSASVYNGTSALDTGSYDFFTAITQSDLESNPDDIGTLSVTERSTGSGQSWTAPANAEDIESNMDDEDVLAAVENGTITQTGEVAYDDYAVVQFTETSGIYGALEAENENVSVTLTEVNPGQNQKATKVDLLDESSAVSPQVVPSDDTNNLFIIFETNNDLNGEWNATLTVEGEELTGDVDGTERASTEFEVVDREASLDTNDDDVVEVEATENGSITGETTIAPASEITVTAQSVSGADNPFVVRKTVNVSNDGTFEANFDMSEFAVGTNFTVKVSASPKLTGDSDDYEYDATVVDAVDDSTTTEEPTTTAEPTTTEEPTTTAEPTTTEEPTETPDEPETTTTTSPGFGIAVALVALAGAALLALRREN